MQQVHLVINVENDGEIMAIFVSEQDAEWFKDSLTEECIVQPRTLFYGQPPNRGYNE